MRIPVIAKKSLYFAKAGLAGGDMAKDTNPKTFNHGFHGWHGLGFRVSIRGIREILG